MELRTYQSEAMTAALDALQSQDRAFIRLPLSNDVPGSHCVHTRINP